MSKRARIESSITHPKGGPLTKEEAQELGLVLDEDSAFEVFKDALSSREHVDRKIRRELFQKHEIAHSPATEHAFDEAKREAGLA